MNAHWPRPLDSRRGLACWGLVLGVSLAAAATAEAQAPPVKSDPHRQIQEARRRFWERVGQAPSWLPGDVVQSQSWSQGTSWSQSGDVLTATLREPGVVIGLKARLVDNKVSLTSIEVRDQAGTRTFKDVAQAPENLRPKIVRFLDNWKKEIDSITP
jgi:hypothetical protein